MIKLTARELALRRLGELQEQAAKETIGLPSPYTMIRYAGLLQLEIIQLIERQEPLNASIDPES